MLRILRNWADNYFSDEEAVYLVVLLLVIGLTTVSYTHLTLPTKA